MRWGAWRATGIHYFMRAQRLLLPGGVLSVGAGFFFGLWWGFLIALVGTSEVQRSLFSSARWIGREWLGENCFGIGLWWVGTRG